MDAIGVNVGFLIVQVLGLAMLGIYVALMIGTLLALRRYPLTAEQQFMWASLIFFVPLLGAAAFWTVGPPAQTKPIP